ncbi:IclR family transcriptional regulator [Bacillus taeanensis]|uniref:Glycerol operon regulatory protein n=1 Tax=Bacillus taeanensis TaxID=273032 RepID=A0A366Y076_9BACI|nr:IclR family transcriptional regulator [Bacillus taeanensis]RBW69804.1 IclR family transcriptional regulator [Bacillus taeanensis]
MIKSVDRALQIITIVSSRKDGFGVTELAEQLELNKSSIFRLLSTLAAHNFIEQDLETKKYRLGYKYLELSSKLLDSIDIRSEAKPFLKELESITKEVIHLVVYDQGEVIYIEKLEGSETLRTHSQVGKRAPMHCTSVGKVILAHLPENEVLSILERKGLPKHTENTIVTKEDLFAELVKIKEQGYGTEIEENEPGITCIAAPIFNNRGEIAAAVSVSGPTIRMSSTIMNEMKDKIIEVTQSISRRLGYLG